jgi:cytochrome c oxidase subunit 2
MRLALGALLLALAVVVDVAAQERTAAQKGRRVFVDSGCLTCHVVGGVGTPMGPDLSRIGARHSIAYLERWLRDPTVHRPAAHMPALELSEAQVISLAAYLATLR